MKRLLSLLLTVGILFALVSCAKEEAQPAPDISTDSKVTETVTMEETFSQTQGEEEKPVENDPTSSITPETTTTAPPVTTTAPPPTTTKAPNTTASSHSHSYVKTGSVAATCTSGGSETFTCSCGSSYVNKSYALGHLYTKWVVIQEATTTSTGKKECKCDICGAAPIYETIPVKVVVATSSGVMLTYVALAGILLALLTKETSLPEISPVPPSTPPTISSEMKYTLLRFTIPQAL